MDKWVARTLKFKESNCIEPVKITDFSFVMSLCSLLDAIQKAEISFKKDILGADYAACAEKLFILCEFGALVVLWMRTDGKKAVHFYKILTR